MSDCEIEVLNMKEFNGDCKRKDVIEWEGMVGDEWYLAFDTTEALGGSIAPHTLHPAGLFFCNNAKTSRNALFHSRKMRKFVEILEIYLLKLTLL